MQCVVPENTHAPPTPNGERRKFQGGGGGVWKEVISEGVGGCLKSFSFQGVWVRLLSHSINNIFSVEHAIS